MWRKPTLLDRLSQYMKMYPPCEHPQFSPHPPSQKQPNHTKKVATSHSPQYYPNQSHPVDFMSQLPPIWTTHPGPPAQTPP